MVCEKRRKRASCDAIRRYMYVYYVLDDAETLVAMMWLMMMLFVNGVMLAAIAPTDTDGAMRDENSG